MLKKTYIRNGKNQIIGSETSGFGDDDTVVRDRDGKILGRANSRFHTTRDAHGRLVSINSNDPGLPFEE
ncbi:hypothetical protein H7849_20335 [Alloacidobacterium dinghuense]|uniref:Uncharacterized protein n=1 Tax=Alloacidobacterium dinghuense TaxID=2763107 RepID=A0A7G8BFT1_9BACT|nr:hypothetical protein [Alloacidobacterium dinghuense]QNI31401.1 hypothetical protein H7849_20335 [Alloacidobacterium dinghuense]